MTCPCPSRARAPPMALLARSSSPCAAAAGVVVGRATARVDEARAAWGATEAVAVVAERARPGEPVVATSPPVPAGPDGSRRRRVDELDAGAVARQDVGAGEILTEPTWSPREVRRGACPRTAAQAVAIAEPVASGVVVGDAVAVASGGIVLSAEGLVVGDRAPTPCSSPCRPRRRRRGWPRRRDVALRADAAARAVSSAAAAVSANRWPRRSARTTPSATR